MSHILYAENQDFKKAQEGSSNNIDELHQPFMGDVDGDDIPTPFENDDQIESERNNRNQIRSSQGRANVNGRILDNK